MPDMFALVLVWVAGILLGAVFFGGLWWTVKKALTSARPALWFVVSLLFRTVVVLAGVYLVAGSDWKRLVACVAGIVSARAAVTKMIRPDPPARDSREAVNHAP